MKQSWLIMVKYAETTMSVSGFFDHNAETTMLVSAFFDHKLELCTAAAPARCAGRENRTRVVRTKEAKGKAALTALPIAHNIELDMWYSIPFVLLTGTASTPRD